MKTTLRQYCHQILKHAITRTALTIVAVIGLAGCAAQGGASSDRQKASSFTAGDEAAVRALVDGFVTTWNRHDMKAMHDLDTDDVEWVNVAGNHWRGKAAVYKGHDTIHRTVFAKTTNTLVETIVRPIAPAVAVTVTTLRFGPVVTPSGEQLREIKTRGSFIMVKRDGVWKIAHFHNTTVDPDAEKDDPITWDDTGFLPGRGHRTP